MKDVLEGLHGRALPVLAQEEPRLGGLEAEGHRVRVLLEGGPELEAGLFAERPSRARAPPPRSSSSGSSSSSATAAAWRWNVARRGRRRLGSGLLPAEPAAFGPVGASMSTAIRAGFGSEPRTVPPPPGSRTKYRRLASSMPRVMGGGPHRLRHVLAGECSVFHFFPFPRVWGVVASRPLSRRMVTLCWTMEQTLLASQ